MPLPFTRAHREARFWRWFQSNSGRLLHFENDREPTFDALTTELHRVHKHLTFEFGPSNNGRREFIVSAGGIQAAFSAVRSLVASAPSMPAWNVIPFRPPKSLAMSLEIGDLQLHATDLWFEACREDERIAIVLYLPGYTSEKHDLFGHAGFILLDCALGEYVVETRVGGIDFRPLPPDPAASGLMPFKDIREIFDVVVH